MDFASRVALTGTHLFWRLILIMAGKIRSKESIRCDSVVVRHIRGIAVSKRNISDEAREHHSIHAQWLEISKTIQYCANLLWREWIAWHTSRGNHIVVKKYMQEKRLWNQTPAKERKGEKPGSCSVNPWPPEFAKHVMERLITDYPSVNLRPLNLAVQKLEGDLRHKNGVKSAFPRWMQILADEIGPISFCSPLPIPLCNSRVRFFPPDKENSKSDWTMELRVDRIEREGMTAQSTCRIVTLHTKGRNRETLKKLAAGEYKRCGANLCYCDSKNEWRVQLGYQFPKAQPAARDAEKVAVLECGIHSPLVLTVNGRQIPIGGKGDFIEVKRESIQREFNSRNETYRWSRDPRKSHGRERATKLLDVIRHRWERFTKDASYRLCSVVLRICDENAIGRIVFKKPSSNDQPNLRLWSAGQRGKTQAGNGWPLYFLEAALNRKSNELGMQVVSREAVAEDGLENIED